MDSVDLTPYREAVRQGICTFCVDQTVGGKCGRSAERPCALESHLDILVEAVLEVGRNPKLDAYVEKVREKLCPSCRQDEDGTCSMRTLVECALDSYMLRVVEVVEEVAAREGHGPFAGTEDMGDAAA